MSTASTRLDRRARVAELARAQAGVVTAAQVCTLGVSWDARQAEVAAGRWLRAGRRTLLVPAARDLDDRMTSLWLAVLETSPSAALGGSSALLAAGLTGWNDERTHVYVPKSADPDKPPGVRVHETRRWDLGDAVTTSGVPRARPAVAAVQGAAWARSLRQAALLLVMPVQQRLCPASEVQAELDRWPRLPRRRALGSVLADVAEGAHSLGELDFAGLVRARGLPEPDRQVVRRGARGRLYLDVEWARYRVVVEVDGVQHLAVEGWVDETLRQNEVTLGDRRVLRIPLLGLRLAPEQFLDQVEAALRHGGWRG